MTSCQLTPPRRTGVCTSRAHRGVFGIALGFQELLHPLPLEHLPGVLQHGLVLGHPASRLNPEQQSSRLGKPRSNKNVPVGSRQMLHRLDPLLQNRRAAGQPGVVRPGTPCQVSRGPAPMQRQPQSAPTLPDVAKLLPCHRRQAQQRREELGHLVRRSSPQLHTQGSPQAGTYSPKTSRQGSSI
jgi:hypothetical protein